MIDPEHVVFIVNGVGGKGTYANGPQPGGIRGGPIAFLHRPQAEQIARQTGGYVEKRTMGKLVEACLQRGCTLFLKRHDRSIAAVTGTTHYQGPQRIRTVPINPDGSPRDSYEYPGSGGYNVRYGFER